MIIRTPYCGTRAGHTSRLQPGFYTLQEDVEASSRDTASAKSATERKAASMPVRTLYSPCSERVKIPAGTRLRVTQYFTAVLKEDGTTLYTIVPHEEDLLKIDQGSVFEPYKEVR